MATNRALRITRPLSLWNCHLDTQSCCGDDDNERTFCNVRTGHGRAAGNVHTVIVEPLVRLILRCCLTCYCLLQRMEYQGSQHLLLRHKNILARYGQGTTPTEEPLESLRIIIALQDRYYIALNRVIGTEVRTSQNT